MKPAGDVQESSQDDMRRSLEAWESEGGAEFLDHRPTRSDARERVKPPSSNPDFQADQAHTA